MGVLKADAAYAKAVRSGDRKAVKATASRMRTAQRRAGLSADPARLVSVGEAVKGRQAYDEAVASGDQRAVRAAATTLRRIQDRAGIQRDHKGRFT